ncbi:MAG: hypothetical protein ABI462_09850, partial [Ignavibacteria bacterium]
GGGEQDPGYRVIIEPDQGEVQLPSHTTDWQVEYKYRVPVKPTTGWSYTSQTVYSYGQIDFDRYGANGKYRLSDYKFNQIVPQVMIGRCLDDDSVYNPSWSNYGDWVIQAQYYWNKNGTSYSLCGNIIHVFPHEEITTNISYTSSSGAITVSISGPSGTSMITLDRPFPNGDTLFTDWSDFFGQAEQKSQTPGAYGNAVLNVETHYLVDETICSMLPFIINDVQIPGIQWHEGNYRVRRDGDYICTDTLANKLALLYYGSGK